MGSVWLTIHRRRVRRIVAFPGDGARVTLAGIPVHARWEGTDDAAVLCKDEVPLTIMILGTLRGISLVMRESTEESGSLVCLELLRDIDRRISRRMTGGYRVGGAWP